MQVTAEPITSVELVRRAASVTAHGAEIRSGIRTWARAEHSPLRAYLWWVEMLAVPYRTSVHLVRHHVGIEHYVSTTRPDLAPDGGEDSKSAPVDHAMLVNAQALINLGRARLCFKAHPKTVIATQRLRKAVAVYDPEMARWMRPECVYRGGYCPEPQECSPGLSNVLRMYRRADAQSGYTPWVDAFDAEGFNDG